MLKTPLQAERRFRVLQRPLASQIIVAGGLFHRAYYKLPDRFIPFEGRFVGGCSCRASAVLG